MNLLGYKRVLPLKMRKLLWYLIAGSKGGINRGRIIESLSSRPQNANQLAETLSLDYKTVVHHLKVLKDNHVITSHGNGYGVMYFIDDYVEEQMVVFHRIWAQVNPSYEYKEDD